MQLYIPDASIILDMFLEDKIRGQKAARFFAESKKEKYRILFPSMWFYEVANILGRKNIPSVKRYKKDLCLYRDEIFPTTDLTSSALGMAFSIMEKYPKVSFYDASYHALAIEQKGIFLTGDKKYFNFTKGEGSIELF